MISRAALYYGAVDLVHQFANQGRLQIVLVAALASGYLYGYAPFGLNAQCFIDSYQ